jgi:hypothetical protein
VAGEISGILSKDRIEQLAPDQASLSAALKLQKPAKWPVLARGDEGDVIWGECQGSRATPYRVVVVTADAGYKCTCPSRKFPCKHVLALQLMACDTPASFKPGSVPDWVREWQARRRPAKAPQPNTDAESPTGPGASLAAAAAAQAEEKQADPKAAARAEAQRQRLRQEREAAVVAGLDELDRWIVDQLSLGLAGFSQRAPQSVRALSARLVDSKAQGLANRIEMLAADLFRAPEPSRDDLLLGRLAGLSLISFAYRDQAALPTALREDVRRAVGWTTRREDLLEDHAALRVASSWSVIAVRSEVQPDRLRRMDTWLLDRKPPPGEVRIALLTDYGPASAGSVGAAFAPGEVIDAEIVFYPSAAPLRGLLNSSTPSMREGAWPALPQGLAAGFAAYESALAQQPWMDAWPMAMSNVRLVSLSADRLALTDSNGQVLPIDMGQTSDALPLLGLAPFSVVVLWDGCVAELLAADTEIGPWYRA